MKKRKLSRSKARNIQQAMNDVEESYEMVRQAWINLANQVSPSHQRRGIFLSFVRLHWDLMVMGDEERLKCMVDLLDIGGLTVVDVFPEMDTRDATKKQIDALRRIDIDGRSLTYAQAERRIREHNRKSKNLQRYHRDKDSKRKQPQGALGSQSVESKETTSGGTCGSASDRVHPEP